MNTMSRSDFPQEIEEFGGDQFADLAEVQVLALPDLSGLLVNVIHELLECGDLVHQEGEIVVNNHQEVNDE